MECGKKSKDINYKEKNIRVLGKGSKERIVFYGEYASDILNIYLNNYCQFHLTILKQVHYQYHQN